MNPNETDLHQQDAADEFHSSKLEEDPRLMETNAIEQKSPCRSTRLPVISFENLGIDDVVVIFSPGGISVLSFRDMICHKKYFSSKVFFESDETWKSLQMKLKWITSLDQNTAPVKLLNP